MDPEAHPETPETRLKRMRMRSWRRGTKEMDLILGPYADQALAAQSGDALDLYDALLAESDTDLYLWVTGAQAAPDRFVALLAQIIGFDRTKTRQL